MALITERSKSLVDGVQKAAQRICDWIDPDAANPDITGQK